jgi:hypothetical protein
MSSYEPAYWTGIESEKGGMATGFKHPELRLRPYAGITKNRHGIAFPPV